MKYSTSSATYFLTGHKKVAHSISRLLGRRVENDGTSEKSAPVIRDMEPNRRWENRKPAVKRAFSELSEPESIVRSKYTHQAKKSITDLPVVDLCDKDKAFVSKAHLDSIIANPHSVAILRTTELNNMPMLERVRTVTQNGIHELARSARRMSRSSLATSWDVESSKKSIKSSNIFLDMTEDGATTPRIFSSLMIVIDDLFIEYRVAQSTAADHI